MVWLVGLAVVVLGIVAVLAIPVQLEVSAELTDRWRGHARLRWWFAVVNLGSRTTVAKKPAPAVAKPKPTAARPGRGQAALAVIRSPGFVTRVVRLGRDLVTRVHVRRFQMRARYGLGDPADTGQLCGTLAPLMAMASARGIDVQCLPEFGDAVLDGACSGTIAVRPLSVLAVIIAFLSSPPAWRAARAWRRAS